MTRPTYRLARVRALQKAGFAHVAGWVRADDAEAIQRTIDEAKPEVEAALTQGGE